MKIVIEITEDCTRKNYEEIKVILDHYLESEWIKVNRSDAYVKEHSASQNRPFTISFEA